jgi:hypothetical protein
MYINFNKAEVCNQVTRLYLDLRERKWEEAGEDRKMRASLTCTFHQTLISDQVKVDRMDGTCSTHGRDKCVQNFELKTWRNKTTWKT